MPSAPRAVWLPGLALSAVLVGGGCDAKRRPSPAASTAPSHAAPPPAATPAPLPPDPDGCVTSPAFLVPLQAYDHHDFIRAVVVDGPLAYYRTYTELRSVPVAGGASTLLASTPGGLLTAPMWSIGDRIVSQSPGESVFIAAPKAGGPFETLLDASAPAAAPGREDAKLRHKTLPAVFDGTNFFFIEQTGVFPDVKESRIRQLPLAGGTARTLYEWHGVLEGLVVSDDSVFFIQREPPKTAPVAGRPLAAPTESALLSLRTTGGKPVVRAPGFKGEPLLGTEQAAYYAGFANGELDKPGVFRAIPSGTSPPESIDWRHVGSALGLADGGRAVVIGTAFLSPPSPGSRAVQAPLALVEPAGGGKLERAFCLPRGAEVRAAALAGKTAVLSVVTLADRRAGLLGVPLENRPARD